MKFKSTKKQREIMGHVCASIAAGKELTLVELSKKISYGPITRSALLCSIKFLEQHEMLVKRIRGNKSMYLTPTVRGFELFKAPAPDFSALT